jgi:hypothetical protein
VSVAGILQALSQQLKGSITAFLKFLFVHGQENTAKQ